MKPTSKTPALQSSPGSKTQSVILLSVVPFLAALAVYSNTLAHGFVFDDLEGILNFSPISNFDRLSKAGTLLGEPWRPVTLLSYGLTHYFFGFDPRFYHAGNVLIHAANSVLVFGIALLAARRWLPAGTEGSFALAAALIHAVHPLHTEAVAYIWGRSASLCAFFYFLSILFTLIGQSSSPKRMYIWYLLALLSGIMAWKAREDAITLPVVISVLFLMTGFWRVAGATLLIPFILVASRSGDIGRLYAQVKDNQALVTAGLEPALPHDIYFVTHLKAAVLYYLRRFVFPLDLNADPQVEAVKHLLDPLLLFSVLVLGSLAVCALATIHKKPIVSFSLFALLASPLTSYGMLPLADVVAEHRVYIAGLGFSLLASWLLTRRPHFTLVALSVASIMMGVLTLERNKIWANSLSLWKDTEAKSPGLARPHLNLGLAYQSDGQLDAALEEYRHALSINPNLSPAYVNMGVIYFSRDQLLDSENALRKAAELSPSLPTPYMNLAILLMRKNSPAEALELLEKAIALGDSYLVRLTKGDVLLQLGRYDEAEREYKRALQLRPELPGVKAAIDTRLEQLRKGRMLR